MKVYFLLNQATGLIGSGPLSALVPVKRKIPLNELDDNATPHMELTLDPTTRLGICDDDKGAHEIADLIAATPLYRISLELMLDQLLDAAEHDRKSKMALKALGDGFVPSVIDNPLAKQYGFEGILNHPGLASRTTYDLFELFLTLSKTMPDRARPIEIFLPHTQAFTDKFDGFMRGDEGWIRFDRLIYSATRHGQSGDEAFENYAERGRQAAESMAIEGRWGLLAAWIQAEHAQMRLCRDIDGVLRISGLVKLPRWVRHDIFTLLEREAMKQVFAETMLKSGKDHMPPAGTPLHDAVMLNAKGGVNEQLQKLMAQTISSDARYSGAAGDFVAEAENRRLQALKILGPI